MVLIYRGSGVGGGELRAGRDGNGGRLRVLRGHTGQLAALGSNSLRSPRGRVRWGPHAPPDHAQADGRVSTDPHGRDAGDLHIADRISGWPIWRHTAVRGAAT